MCVVCAYVCTHTHVHMWVCILILAVHVQVQCLEEERLQGEQVQSKYQTIIQNQKSDNAGLSRQLNELRTLQEDFDR